MGKTQPPFYQDKRNRHKYTKWPKKVSHYRESSLNRIKNRQPG